MSTTDVLIRVSSHCGRITLNRPAAINAVTLEMVIAIHAALDSWASDPAIGFVLIDGAGERGLCAGGDIRALYNAAISSDLTPALDFFRNEYQLTFAIARFPKPYIALMDGIVMGGGIGISAHGSHRIVTERSQLAMPETAIGFVPDVGGTYLLGTTPDEFGTWLALTGSRIGAADAIDCGLADVMVPSAHLSQLTHDLEHCASPHALAACLQSHAAEPIPGMPSEDRAWMDECFAADTVEEIVAALAAHPNPAANATLQELARKSPTSLKVTLAALRNARRWNDLEPCIRQEYRIAQACLREHDFIEGIRAAIIDKDRNPHWRPSRLEAITPQDIQPYFTKTGMDELDLRSYIQMEKKSR